MKKKKTKIILLIPLIIALGFYLLWREITSNGLNNLGDLSSPCKNEYKINISHDVEFDDKQALYFCVKKNDKIIKGIGGQFAVTNNMDESLDNFEIECCDNILFVKDKDGSIVYIMFDVINNDVYPCDSKSYNEDKYKKILFERIKKGNPKLEIQ